MHLAGCRLLNRVILCYFLFFCSSLYSDWDDEFYQQSIELFNSLPSLQHSSYLATVQDLVNSITELKQNVELCNEVDSLKRSKRKNLFNRKEGYVIKKRSHNCVKDAYVWELTYIFDLPSLVPPTYVFSISEKKCIFQHLVKCHCTICALCGLPSQYLSQVTLEKYWKAHLFAYALGFNDLSGSNIGVLPDEGEIIFFDNEGSLFPDKVPFETRLSFYVPFVSMAFDWPQYRQAIGRELAFSLKQYVGSLAQKKEEIELYFTMRGVPKFTHPVLKNFKKIEEFVFHPNTSFLDFFAYLYPQIAPGLDELAEIIGDHNKKVGHGSALFYATRAIRYRPLKEKNRAALEKWIEKYVREEMKLTGTFN